jgi:hypothetical protein
LVVRQQIQQRELPHAEPGGFKKMSAIHLGFRWLGVRLV